MMSLEVGKEEIKFNGFECVIYCVWGLPFRDLHGSPMGDPFENPMGTHLVNWKYLFKDQMLSDKKHIVWKLIHFCIDSCRELSSIQSASRIIGSFLINPRLKCFEIFPIFHGLLLWLQKENEIKILVNQSQESLEKNSWGPIAILCSHYIENHFLL